MSKAWLACCFIGLVASAGAEESTFAWHLAAMPYVIGSEDPKKIEVSPTPTTFIAPGDRLMDLSPTIRADIKGGDETWLIWNDTRRLLVVHGGARAIAYVGEYFGYDVQPRKAAITLCWYEGIAPGGAVPAEAEPVHRMELFGKSGSDLKGSSRMVDTGKLISVEHEVMASRDSDNARSSLSMRLGWTERDGARSLDWKLATEVELDTLQSAPRTIFQASSPSGGNWTITASVRDLFLDDVPVSAGIQAEIGGKAARRYGPEFGYQDSPAKLKIGDTDYLVHEYGLPRSRMSELIEFVMQSRGSSKKDESGSSGLASLMQLPELDIPPALRALAPVAMLDLGPLAERLGKDNHVPVSKGAIIGYESGSERLLIALPADADFSSVADLIPSSCAPGYGVSMLIAASVRKSDGVVAERKILLAAATGQQATVTCRVPDHPDEEEESEEPPALIDCKVTGSNKEGAVDFQYDLQLEEFGSGPALRLKGEQTLPVSVPVPLRTSLSEEGGTTLAVKAELVPIKPEAAKP